MLSSDAAEPKPTPKAQFKVHTLTQEQREVVQTLQHNKLIADATKAVPSI